MNALRDPSTRARIEAKYVPEPNTGCWLWTASYGSSGYGQFNLNGKVWGAHRLLYEMNVGPIPVGLELDHLCRTRGCCNPDHLEPVTRRENMLRGNTIAAAHARKTHCPKGHAYSVENTRLSNGSRECRRCIAIRGKARYARLTGRAA